MVHSDGAARRHGVFHASPSQHVWCICVPADNLSASNGMNLRVLIRTTGEPSSGFHEQDADIVFVVDPSTDAVACWKNRVRFRR
jgi:hypothetical protein